MAAAAAGTTAAVGRLLAARAEQPCAAAARDWPRCVAGFTGKHFTAGKKMTSRTPFIYAG
jgi:hypothetical protein